MSNVNLKAYIVTVWEKAEHWTFEATIRAENETQAYEIARKEFPKRSYNVREVRHYYSAGEK